MSHRYERDGVYFTQIANAIREAGFTTYEFATYVAMCFFADNDTGEAYPSHARLAKEIGASRASVKRAIEGLRDKGWVLVEHRKNEDGSPATNVYRILHAPIASQERVGSDRPHPGSGRTEVGSERATNYTQVTKPNELNGAPNGAAPVVVQDVTAEMKKELRALCWEAMLRVNDETDLNKGREGKAVERLIVKALAKPDPPRFMRAILVKFYDLRRTEEKFWNEQPFTASRLESNYLSVLEKLRVESVAKKEEANQDSWDSVFENLR